MRIYLACPYSDPDPEVRHLRFKSACRKAGELMQEGHVVFSPLSHSVPVADTMSNHLDHDFWLGQDVAFLEWCDEMLVLTLPGWNESKGVRCEIEWCIAHRKSWRSL